MLGPLLSIGTTLLGHHLAKNRQSDAQDFSAGQFATRYQTTVDDMKKAGLNPMLAYGQGGGSPPSSSAVSSNVSDVGQAYLQQKMNSAQVANIEADTRVKDEQAALARAQTANYMSSANQADAMVTKIGQEVMNLKEQFKNIPLEGNRLKAATMQLIDHAGLLVQQGMTQDEVRSHLTALVNKLKAETKLLDFDIEAASNLGNIGRESGQLKPLADILIGILKSRAR